jgi:hypothetical protein
MVAAIVVMVATVIMRIAPAMGLTAAIVALRSVVAAF